MGAKQSGEGQKDEAPEERRPVNVMRVPQLRQKVVYVDPDCRPAYVPAHGYVTVNEYPTHNRKLQHSSAAESPANELPPVAAAEPATGEAAGSAGDGNDVPVSTGGEENKVRELERLPSIAGAQSRHVYILPKGEQAAKTVYLFGPDGTQPGKGGMHRTHSGFLVPAGGNVEGSSVSSAQHTAGSSTGTHTPQPLVSSASKARYADIRRLMYDAEEDEIHEIAGVMKVAPIPEIVPSISTTIEASGAFGSGDQSTPRDNESESSSTPWPVRSEMLSLLDLAIRAPAMPLPPLEGTAAASAAAKPPDMPTSVDLAPLTYTPSLKKEPSGPAAAKQPSEAALVEAGGGSTAAGAAPAAESPKKPTEVQPAVSVTVTPADAAEQPAATLAEEESNKKKAEEPVVEEAPKGELAVAEAAEEETAKEEAPRADLMNLTDLPTLALMNQQKAEDSEQQQPAPREVEAAAQQPPQPEVAVVEPQKQLTMKQIKDLKRKFKRWKTDFTAAKGHAPKKRDIMADPEMAEVYMSLSAVKEGAEGGAPKNTLGAEPHGHEGDLSSVGGSSEDEWDHGLPAKAEAGKAQQQKPVAAQEAPSSPTPVEEPEVEAKVEPAVAPPAEEEEKPEDIARPSTSQAGEPASTIVTTVTSGGYEQVELPATPQHGKRKTSAGEAPRPKLAKAWGEVESQPEPPAGEEQAEEPQQKVEAPVVPAAPVVVPVAVTAPTVKEGEEEAKPDISQLSKKELKKVLKQWKEAYTKKHGKPPKKKDIVADPEVAPMYHRLMQLEGGEETPQKVESIPAPEPAAPVAAEPTTEPRAAEQVADVRRPPSPEDLSKPTALIQQVEATSPAKSPAKQRKKELAHLLKQWKADFQAKNGRPATSTDAKHDPAVAGLYAEHAALVQAEKAAGGGNLEAQPSLNATMNLTMAPTTVVDTPEQQQAGPVVNSSAAGHQEALDASTNKDHAGDHKEQKKMLNKKLAQWKRDFKASHGRAPTSTDLKNDFEASQWYDQMTKLRDGGGDAVESTAAPMKEAVSSPVENDAVKNSSNGVVDVTPVKRDSGADSSVTPPQSRGLDGSVNTTLGGQATPSGGGAPDKTTMKEQGKMLKQWKAKFLEANGRQPTASDMKQDPAIYSVYTEYTKAKKASKEAGGELNETVTDLGGTAVGGDLNSTGMTNGGAQPQLTAKQLKARKKELKEALSVWKIGFKEQNGRAPTETDVANSEVGPQFAEFKALKSEA